MILWKVRGHQVDRNIRERGDSDWVTEVEPGNQGEESEQKLEQGSSMMTMMFNAGRSDTGN